MLLSPSRVVVAIVKALRGSWRVSRQLRDNGGCPGVTCEAVATVNRGVKLDDDFLSATAKVQA